MDDVADDPHLSLLPVHSPAILLQRRWQCAWLDGDSNGDADADVVDDDHGDSTYYRWWSDGEDDDDDDDELLTIIVYNWNWNSFLG